MKTILKLSPLIALVFFLGCQKTQNNGPVYSSRQAAPGNYDYQVYHGPLGKTGDVLPTDLFDNNVVDSIMSSRGLTYRDSIIRYYTDSTDQSVIYHKHLNSVTDAKLNLFIVSSNDNLANIPVLAETKMIDSTRKQCKFSSFISGDILAVVVVDQDGKVISVDDNPAETSVGGSGGSKPCSETTNNYKDCFKCSWGQLTDEAFGTLTCSLNPVMCLMACGVSCAMFPVPPPDHPPFTYSDVTSLSLELINGGKYNGSISTAGEKKFLFLY